MGAIWRKDVDALIGDAGHTTSKVCPGGTDLRHRLLHPLANRAAFDQTHGAIVGTLHDKIGRNA